MNIVLIGMPGSGKSTVGVLLAKSMLLDFIDTDLIIQNKLSLPLQEIIKQKGTAAFIEIEDNILSELKSNNSVIATGGSAVYGENAMQNLKKDAKTIYLKLPLSEIEKRINNIKTRGIVMAKNETLADIYEARTPLYEEYADITINCKGLSAEECVDAIMAKLIKF